MLKVLGAGQPRTGTNSLKEALEILGFGPCYHMLTLLQEHPEDVTYFTHARDGKPVDWDALFAKHQSGVDFPVALFYKDLLKKYPDAKVVLSVRDADKWFKSISDTVFPASQPSLLKKLQTMLQFPFSKEIRRRMPVLIYAGNMIRNFYGPNLKDKDAVTAKFKQWNENVIKNIPAGQLLVYEVSEGWEPLCTFLGVPVPNIPFPKKNTTEEFQKRAELINSGKAAH